MELMELMELTKLTKELPTINQKSLSGRAI